MVDDGMGDEWRYTTQLSSVERCSSLDVTLTSGLYLTEDVDSEP